MTLFHFREGMRPILRACVESAANRTPVECATPRRKAPRRWALNGSAGRQCGTTSICALLVMTSNESKRRAFPHRDARIPSRIRRFRLPRPNQKTPTMSRDMHDTRRIRHGIARAIESLRRVWMPLVPHSEPWECILQILRDKADGLSNA